MQTEELMQPQDLLVFASNIHERQYWDRWQRACDHTVQMDARSGVKNRSLESRVSKTYAFMGKWERERVLGAVCQEHYEVGSVFDFHGVSAMVESAGIATWVLGTELRVNAMIRSPKGGLERVEIGEDLALALVWRKFNIENT